MSPNQPMRIGVPAMLGWVLAAGVCVGAAGAYPTWALSGSDGLHVELLAAGVAFVTITACGLYVVRAARKGPGRAAFGFIVAGSVAGAGAMVPAAAAWLAWGLPALPLFLWTAIFSFAMLVGQSLWLYKGLRRDAFRVALGQIRRPEGF